MKSTHLLYALLGFLALPSYVKGQNNVIEEEVFSLEPSYLLSVYLPIGLNFRFSKSNEFWKRTHLYSELRPSWRYFANTNWRTRGYFDWGLSVLGLRLELLD